ncbi:unnamed protein product [Lactuca saligna]|uniref:Uncharacterized protein n=1 Tax=Lactuca saligna TaxID=75948 RepID=A0AA36DZL1_LACSI|nr:unnamed protein product [Lactuca saligna]
MLSHISTSSNVLQQYKKHPYSEAQVSKPTKGKTLKKRKSDRVVTSPPELKKLKKPARRLILQSSSNSDSEYVPPQHKNAPPSESESKSSDDEASGRGDTLPHSPTSKIPVRSHPPSPPPVTIPVSIPPIFPIPTTQPFASIPIRTPIFTDTTTTTTQPFASIPIRTPLDLNRSPLSTHLLDLFLKICSLISLRRVTFSNNTGSIHIQAQVSKPTKGKTPKKRKSDRAVTSPPELKKLKKPARRLILQSSSNSDSEYVPPQHKNAPPSESESKSSDDEASGRGDTLPHSPTSKIPVRSHPPSPPPVTIPVSIPPIFPIPTTQPFASIPIRTPIFTDTTTTTTQPFASIPIRTPLDLNRSPLSTHLLDLFLKICSLISLRRVTFSNNTGSIHIQAQVSKPTKGKTPKKRKSDRAVTSPPELKKLKKPARRLILQSSSNSDSEYVPLQHKNAPPSESESKSSDDEASGRGDTLPHSPTSKIPVRFHPPSPPPVTIPVSIPPIFPIPTTQPFASIPICTPIFIDTTTTTTTTGSEDLEFDSTYFSPCHVQSDHDDDEPVTKRHLKEVNEKLDQLLSSSSSEAHSEDALKALFSSTVKEHSVSLSAAAKAIEASTS